MYRGHKAFWFIVQIEHMCEFSLHSVAHTIFIHMYLCRIHTRVQFKYRSSVVIIRYWDDCKTPCAIDQLHVKWIWYPFRSIPAIRWIFSTNSNLLIDFITITGFTTLLIYFGLFSVSAVSVPLNKQTRGTLTLDTVDIVPNLLDGIFFLS